MNKISKEKAYELIVAEMKKGTAKDIILSDFVIKCQKDKRTIERYYRIAQEKFNAIQIEVENKKTQEYTQNELEAQKRLILDRNKVLQMTSNILKIAYNNAVKKKDDKSIYAFTTANSNYSKLQGFDAPTKIASTDSEGKDVEVVPTIVITTNASNVKLSDNEN